MISFATVAQMTAQLKFLFNLLFGDPKITLFVLVGIGQRGDGPVCVTEERMYFSGASKSLIMLPQDFGHLEIKHY